MAYEVHAIRGDIYLNPTSANVGGTLLPGVDPNRPIRLFVPHGLLTEHHGLEQDALRSYKDAWTGPILLGVPAEGGDVETLKLLFGAHTADGVTIQSAGGNALKAAQDARQTPAVVRPAAGSQFWYFPRLQLFEQSDPLLNRSAEAVAQIDDSLLLMLCARPDNADYDAAFIGAVAAIDTHYELGGEL